MVADCPDRQPGAGGQVGGAGGLVEQAQQRGAVGAEQPVQPPRRCPSVGASRLRPVRIDAIRDVDTAGWRFVDGVRGHQKGARLDPWEA